MNVRMGRIKKEMGSEHRPDVASAVAVNYNMPV
jgi:hypothetical protein